MANSIYVGKVLEFLRDHTDFFVLIGGTATEIGLSEKGITFRATKDFDMVLLLDIQHGSFDQDIVRFLEGGQYQHAIANMKKTSYRFDKPGEAGYPKIIEFFAKTDVTSKAFNKYLKKVNISYEDSFLSAIVLDESVYDFIKERKVLSQLGIPVVDLYGLIPLKALAFINNKNLYEEGKIHSEDDYKKHRTDIIRLLVAVSDTSSKIGLPDILKQAVNDFYLILEKSRPSFKALNFTGVTFEDMLEVYRQLYL